MQQNSPCQRNPKNTTMSTVSPKNDCYRSSNSKQKGSVNRDKSNDRSALKKCQKSDAVWTSVMERAEGVREKLPPEFPSFSKTMLKSHVSNCFWLALPNKFCAGHLPKHDAKVVLVDENGEECDARYLAFKNALSGGWKGFCISHDLHEKDVLVFQLIAPCKFKVYIVRSEKPTLIDKAALDSEIPPHVKPKYDELCLSQNMLLHENLMGELNPQLVVGIISEAINIADAIRHITPSIDPSVLESWDKKLRAFEDLGMEVGFLRARISKLLSLSLAQSQAKIGKKRKEREEVEKEMEELRAKLLNVEKLVRSLGAEIDDLKAKNKELEAEFLKVGHAPW